MSNIFSSLDKVQVEAVKALDGPVLIYAGAGSGKTRLLTHRVAYLIELGISPEEIVCITFTNKAAEEMTKRLHTLVGKDLADRMQISTFHSLSAMLLRKAGYIIGVPKKFVIYDEDDTKKLINSILNDMDLDDIVYPPSFFITSISNAKNELLTVSDYYNTYIQYNNSHNKSEHELIHEVFLKYTKRLNQAEAIDFDDLLVKAAQLVGTQAGSEWVKKRYKYVLVDEYQDTNYAQSVLATRLSEHTGNYCVVGDVSQCLVEESTVLTPNGNVPIKDIVVGDTICVGVGKGKVDNSIVTNITRKYVDTTIIKIITKLGNIIKSTPEHVHFADYTSNINKKHIVYLMYKEGIGYRIGTSNTSNYNYYGNRYKSRLNQEYATMLWILDAFDTDTEARYHEQLYSVVYGIPTWVFYSGSSRGIGYSQDSINKLFGAVNTEYGAKKLLEAKYMFWNKPQHIPQCIGNRKRTFTITLCGDIRNNCILHRYSIQGKDISTGEMLKSLGLSVRGNGKATGWRVESSHKNIHNIYDILETVSKNISINVYEKANLSTGKNLQFLPASHVKPGMTIFSYDSSTNTIIDDEVIEVSTEIYKGFIYDINVKQYHNFIANNIVTHNSIYGFRGSDPTIIMNFEKEYPNTKKFILNTNYRSTANIVNAAGSVIKNNVMRPDYTCRSNNENGTPVYISSFRDDYSETEFVVNKILSETKYKKNYSDYGVLFRTNAQSRIFEGLLRAAGIPYELVGALEFFSRAEVKDFIAYLRLAYNTNDDASFKRIVNLPTRGIGDTTVKKLDKAADESGYSIWRLLSHTDTLDISQATKDKLFAFSEIIDEIKELMNTKELADIFHHIYRLPGMAEYYLKDKKMGKVRIDNIGELISVAVEFKGLACDKVEEFLEKVTLTSDAKVDPGNSVKIMSLHQAKGLEFDTVFLTGLEEGLFPHERCCDTIDHLEEERRLCYVGMTRAKNTLYMTMARARSKFGKYVYNVPSRFFSEVDKQYTELIRG